MSLNVLSFNYVKRFHDSKKCNIKFADLDSQTYLMVNFCLCFCLNNNLVPLNKKKYNLRQNILFEYNLKLAYFKELIEFSNKSNLFFVYLANNKIIVYIIYCSNSNYRINVSLVTHAILSGIKGVFHFIKPFQNLVIRSQ